MQDLWGNQPGYRTSPIYAGIGLDSVGNSYYFLQMGKKYSGGEHGN